MAAFDVLIKSLDSSVWEMSEAFKGLPDADVWQRPDPRLLSVGELAAHVAYWEALSFLGEGFESPLTKDLPRYYTSNVSQPFTANLGAEAVFNEVKRIHEACKAAFLSQPHELAELNPFRQDWTWEYVFIYQAFHFGYHTGQMYSVRHLLGHETADN
ncbi:MAG: DinB family protein [Armatimonadetes bacterium]|nr:DinB family protein [Armatimonadota bacterium]